MDVAGAVAASGDPKLEAKVQQAVAIINRTLDLYGPQGVAFSFNGGKDSTVLLHLVRAAVAQRFQQQGAAASNGAAAGLGGILTFFFYNEADFSEITEFTYATDTRYGLAMEVLHGDFKAGIEALLSRNPIKAILLGTRKADPNAGDQETFCPSSPGWPPFMRVNPILDWSYHDVWAFLRATAVPYCTLYDRGYTSIGAVHNTSPNQALLQDDGSYGPAHNLPDARLERAGRTSKRAPSGDAASPPPGSREHRAGLVIIGDEILSAKVEDVNMRFLCSELRAMGWRVERAVFLRDDVDAIAAELRSLSAAVDVVITAGGLGPTLDDVTMRAVGEALGTGVGRHPHLAQRIRGVFGAGTTEAHLKMAETPRGSEVALIDYAGEDGGVAPFPLVRCRNVYVLPGVPTLLRKKWRALREHLLRHHGGSGGVEPFHSIVLRLRLQDETMVAAALEAVAAQCGEGVQLGSYPVREQSDGCEVVLSLEGKDAAVLEEARGQLVGLLPPGVVASEHRDADHALHSPAEAPTLGP